MVFSNTEIALSLNEITSIVLSGLILFIKSKPKVYPPQVRYTYLRGLLVPFSWVRMKLTRFLGATQSRAAAETNMCDTRSIRTHIMH